MPGWQRRTCAVLVSIVVLLSGSVIFSAIGCTLPAPGEVRFSQPQDLPMHIVLKPGGRLVLTGTPYASKESASVTGNLEVLSKPGDTMLTIGARADTNSQPSTVSVMAGNRNWMSEISVQEEFSGAVTIADFVHPSRRPIVVEIPADGDLEVRIGSSSGDVWLLQDDAPVDPKRKEFHFQTKIFRALYNFNEPSRSEIDLVVVQGAGGKTHRTPFKLRMIPVRRC